MHFLCECGNRITDNTDYLSYKAHCISDQDWSDFLDKIDEAIEKSGPTPEDKENALMGIRSLAVNMTKTIYLCRKCGNIFFDNIPHDNFEMYKNCSEDINTRLLESYKGEKWEGILFAEWVDEKKEWQETNGYISQYVNFNSNKIPGNKRYNDWKNLEKDYYMLFNEFKEKGILRSSILKKNKILIHSWNMNNE